ncbi:MAG: malto-oligosyltrehalose synthase, partial [Sphingobium sp.]
MMPRATYRLQLHAGFTFADAEGIVPYLDRLGISHVYASPITKAAKGSMHGYDVVDPTQINPELGGEAGLRSLVAAIRARGMGFIIDIVPNHMGVAGDENLWWMDVLEKGEASAYGPVFDIDWREAVTLPVLGAPLAEVIAAGDMRIVPRRTGLGLQLYEGAIYPVRADDPAMGDDMTSYDPATPAGRAELAALAARQHYRLTYWRAANDSLNWRRFFSINELAGVRVEDEAVFDLTHRLFFGLFRDGLIDGVRVDHIDGLSDPASYSRRLRAGFEAIDAGRRAYIVVEKILAAEERLPTDWGTDGTSGYDFMREVSGLLHDPAGAAPLANLWTAISGRSADFAVEAVQGRRDILVWQFEGQLVACVDAFVLLARSAGRDWVTAGMLRRAIERLLWVFPVYRTYGTGKAAPPADAGIRQRALERTLVFAPPGEEEIPALLLDWLGGTGGGDAILAADAVRRFQQLSAPIAAKGVEDTAFYRHGVLLSGNDVGFEPERLATTIPEFHAAMQERGGRHPRAMLATGTHDHKRGPDARARLAVLSALPDLWAERAKLWLAKAQSLAPHVHLADAYMLLQAMVGVWEPAAGALLPRIHDWQEKALREAKLRSSWEAPEEAYEGMCKALSSALLGDADFYADFAGFMDHIAPAARANSLAQTALHFTVPGVPDLYQGAELPDFSMVDPDNRRPGDYAGRIAMLDSGPSDAKLTLIAELLRLRRTHPRLFWEGSYRPLIVHGRRADHIVAFAREAGPDTLIAAVAVRLAAALAGTELSVPPAHWWSDTVVEDAGQTWRADRLFS